MRESILFIERIDRNGPGLREEALLELAAAGDMLRRKVVREAVVVTILPHVRGIERIERQQLIEVLLHEGIQLLAGVARRKLGGW